MYNAAVHRMWAALSDTRTLVQAKVQRKIRKPWFKDTCTSSRWIIINDSPISKTLANVFRVVRVFIFKTFNSFYYPQFPGQLSEEQCELVESKLMGKFQQTIDKAFDKLAVRHVPKCNI